MRNELTQPVAIDEVIIPVTERRFPKPLSVHDAELIELVTKRYYGVDAPFVKFDEDDAVVLRIPQVVRRKWYDEQVQSEAV